MYVVCSFPRHHLLRKDRIEAYAILRRCPPRQLRNKCKKRSQHFLKIPRIPQSASQFTFHNTNTASMSGKITGPGTLNSLVTWMQGSCIPISSQYRSGSAFKRLSMGRERIPMQCKRAKFVKMDFTECDPWISLSSHTQLLTREKLGSETSRHTLKARLDSCLKQLARYSAGTVQYGCLLPNSHDLTINARHQKIILDATMHWYPLYLKSTLLFIPCTCTAGQFSSTTPTPCPAQYRHRNHSQPPHKS